MWSPAGRLFPRPQLLYRGPGRVLLRLFFAAAAALADGEAVEIHLHREDLGVIGALGADELVAQHLAALPLHQLLEGGLVIAAGALLRLP